MICSCLFWLEPFFSFRVTSLYCPIYFVILLHAVDRSPPVKILPVVTMSCPALSRAFVDISAKINIDPSQSHSVLLSQFASPLRLWRPVLRPSRSTAQTA